MATGTSISHAGVLTDWDQDALPKLLKLEKVMPGLMQRKVVPKRIGKGILKEKDVITLIGILKAKPIQVFVNFLQALADTFPECEAHIELVLKMKDSLKCIGLSPDSEAHVHRAAIQEVIDRAALMNQSTQPDVQSSVREELPTAGEPDLTNVVDVSSSEVVSKDVDEESARSQMQAADFQTCATHSDSHTAANPSVPQPASPNPASGYIEPCRSWQFTREGMVRKGGFFHCPAHGIIGHIPATAVPPEIDIFEICMKVFMQGDFRFPDFIEPCTAIVEFSLAPPFEFIEDVTIQIPHCAAIDGEIDPETFCLLKISKKCAPGVEVLEARYSNYYHVIANLRHFCKLVGGHKIRQRRWSRSNSTGISKRDSPRSTRDCLKKIRHGSTLRDLARQGSVTSQQSSPSLTGSFESSWEDQGTSPSPIPQTIAQSLATPCHLVRQEAVDVGRNALLLSQQSSSGDGSCNLYIVQCMRRQCTGVWEINFLLSCALPTAMLVLLQAVKKASAEVKTKHLCKPTDSYLAFNPQRWDKDGWDVMATETPMIDMQDVTQFYYFSKEQVESLVNAGLYPSRISYLVNHIDASNPAPLECKIVVNGAEINGEQLYFMLTLPSQTLTTSKSSTVTRRLHMCEDLYQPESNICSAVCGSHDLPLDYHSEDHRRFIADISFQLTQTDLQYLMTYEGLGIEKPQLDAIVNNHRYDMREQIYQVLLTWMSRNFPHSTVKSLLSILKTLGISRIERCRWSVESIEKRVCSQLSKISPIQYRDKFLLNLAQEIQQHRRFVGRFIGMSEANINAILQDNLTENQSELSYQMLCKWQQLKGREATYGTLVKAIYRVFEHDPSSMCSAWWLATSWASNP